MLTEYWLVKFFKISDQALTLDRQIVANLWPCSLSLLFPTTDAYGNFAGELLFWKVFEADNSCWYVSSSRDGEISAY